MKFAPKLFFLFFAILSIGYSSIVFATYKPNLPRYENIYITPESVQVTKKGIFIKHNGKKYHSSQLNSDKNGLYAFTVPSKPYRDELRCNVCKRYIRLCMCERYDKR